MKATGIVRRIDDLGRVVIPKEIRKMCDIRDGDPLELFITSEGSVIFQKYRVPLDREFDYLRNKLIDYTDDYSYARAVNKKIEELKEIIKEHEKWT